jgi:hypothetical protein
MRGLIVLGAVGLGVWWLSGKLRFRTNEEAGGVWSFTVYRRDEIVHVDAGPYTSRVAAAAAASAWIAGEVARS